MQCNFTRTWMPFWMMSSCHQKKSKCHDKHRTSEEQVCNFLTIIIPVGSQAALSEKIFAGTLMTKSRCRICMGLAPWRLSSTNIQTWNSDVKAVNGGDKSNSFPVPLQSKYNCNQCGLPAAAPFIKHGGELTNPRDCHHHNSSTPQSLGSCFTQTNVCWYLCRKTKDCIYGKWKYKIKTKLTWRLFERWKWNKRN